MKKKGKSISLTVALAFLLRVHTSEVSGRFLAILHTQAPAIMAAWEESRDCYVPCSE